VLSYFTPVALCSNVATFNNYTTFEGARFFNAASFIGMRGERTFSLSKVRFEKLPDFEQAHFSEAPRIDVRNLMGLPSVPKAYSDRVPAETTRWRALKRLAIQAHDYESEQCFFVEEIRSLRGTVDRPLPRPWNWILKGEPLWPGGARYWVGLLYQLFSDFGRSIIRPFICWVAITILFACYYYYLSQGSNAVPS
jgi:hypothetical protein